MSHHQKNDTVLLGTKRFDHSIYRQGFSCHVLLSSPYHKQSMLNHPVVKGMTSLVAPCFENTSKDAPWDWNISRYIYTIKFEPNVGKSFIHGIYGHVNMVNLDSKYYLSCRHLDKKMLPSNKKTGGWSSGRENKQSWIILNFIDLDLSSLLNASVVQNVSQSDFDGGKNIVKHLVMQPSLTPRDASSALFKNKCNTYCDFLAITTSLNQLTKVDTTCSAVVLCVVTSLCEVI